MIEVSIINQGKQLRDAEDLADLAKLLKEQPNVEILTLQGNSLAPGAGKELARLIKDLSLNNIKVLNFSDLFTGRVRAEIPPTLTYVFDALMIAGCKLEKIDLSDNAFGPDGAKPCIPLLKDKACLSSLKELRFNNNGLGAGAVVISKALRQANEACNFTYPLETLVMGRNRLENPGAKALANAMIKMPKIKKIGVPQNGIRPAGIVALSNALCNCKTLEVLDISDNCMTSKAGIPMAKAIGNLCNLKEINFSDTLIRNRGIGALGLALETHKYPNLETINVGFGEIKARYAVKFAEQVNNSNQNNKITLNLNGNELGETAIEQIKKLENIKLLLDDDGEVEGDEGSPEHSSDEESEDELTDTDEINEADYEISAAYKKGTEEKSEACTVKEFLKEPTGPKLLGLGDKDADVTGTILSELKINSYRELIDLYLKLASCLTDSSHTRTMDVLAKASDEIFALAFKRVKNETFVINYLLTKIGLVKDENEKSGSFDYENCNIRGVLLSLQRIVGQKYFPKSCSLVLKTVIDKPPIGGDYLRWGLWKHYPHFLTISGQLYF